MRYDEGVLSTCCQGRNSNNTHRLKPLVEMLEQYRGSSKMFGIPKREPDFCIGWCVPSILFIQAIERKG